MIREENANNMNAIIKNDLIIVHMHPHECIMDGQTRFILSHFKENMLIDDNECSDLFIIAEKFSFIIFEKDLDDIGDSRKNAFRFQNLAELI